ncbi:hypothetical protein [Paenibacillus macquariensis]|uniref:Heparinase II/III-like protein n=1 Tax=Paenibacillus macquariensis TaxID=948756 RepID=A0ABY1KDT4_9BACL|nr:hypothetical protein [Paenibacillus macquariensis]MEC0093826.1 hypothetical protein [Paenibacillus macquariensis]OAB33609.1 hypothetical protein PMSM_13350 [Paenibacillus macquariensis subsp. macquariensis]SIR67431.1 hypothetical protein SAMN05421578_1315 [Paenibacillus macquariensis]
MSLYKQSFDHKELLLNKIMSQEKDYDPRVNMLIRPLHTPGYHTTLTSDVYPLVHPTHPSLLYAVGLLNSEDPENVQRASDIIQSVLALQDRDPERDTYGIWPWFYEESLIQMDPPDWNWADFCGKELVLAALLHGPLFTEDLREQIQQGISCACDAIIKRDMGPHYTNISIMGAFVTLIAGELYGRQDYVDYALQRLEKLKQYTEGLRTFQEFNSPHYSVIAIIELSKLVTYSSNSRAKEIAIDLLDIGWRMVADHYHPISQQWAGPHSRSYSTLLTNKIKSFLQIATDNRLYFFSGADLEYDTEWYGSGFQCPEKYLDLFMSEDTRVLEQPYYRNEDTGLVKWAKTIITPQYTIGIFKNEIMWNQTRGMVAYFENNGSATYLQMRCLHDGYDYCSGVLSASEDEGHLLLGVRFLTNGGDTHPGLDRIDGSIEASDLRIRLEFGGCLDGVNVTTKESKAEVEIDGIPLRMDNVYAAFDVMSDVDGKEHRGWDWEVTVQEHYVGLDLVIYTGERKIIDFNELNRAAFLFSLAIGEVVEKLPDISVTEEAGHVTASVVTSHLDRLSHEVSIALKPNAIHPV